MKFARSLRNRWALGDCGNSAVILLWRRYKKALFKLSYGHTDYLQIYISGGPISRRYLTDREQKTILNMVQLELLNAQWQRALEIVIGVCTRVVHTQECADNVRAEFNGEPELPTDIGTLSLVTTVSVALFFVLVITGECALVPSKKYVGCVCAFRCFGNLHGADEDKRQTLSTMGVAGLQPFAGFNAPKLLSSQLGGLDMNSCVRQLNAQMPEQKTGGCACTLVHTAHTVQARQYRHHHLRHQHRQPRRDTNSVRAHMTRRHPYIRRHHFMQTIGRTAHTRCHGRAANIGCTVRSCSTRHPLRTPI
jgi:hypothetical protein